jgi:hypothetical protein
MVSFTKDQLREKMNQDYHEEIIGNLEYDIIQRFIGDL